MDRRWGIALVVFAVVGWPGAARAADPWVGRTTDALLVDQGPPAQVLDSAGGGKVWVYVDERTSLRFDRAAVHRR